MSATGLAALVALVLVFAPAACLSGLLGVSGDAATEFMTKRYGASATAGLPAVAFGAVRRLEADRSVFLGFAVWFAVQGAVAIWGVALGMVGGLAWLAVIADRLLAAAFLALAFRADRNRRAVAS